MGRFLLLLLVLLKGRERDGGWERGRKMRLGGWGGKGRGKWGWGGAIRDFLCGIIKH